MRYNGVKTFLKSPSVGKWNIKAITDPSKYHVLDNGSKEKLTVSYSIHMLIFKA